jgi:hypothetical protein
MNTEIDNAILKLDQHRKLSLREANGECIRVHRGRVWVTRDRDIRDHVVNSGESFVIERTGTTVLTAMSDAGVSLMKRCASSAGMFGKKAIAQSEEVRSEVVLTNTAGGDYPRYREIDRSVDCAHQLRARYVADALRNGWVTLRSALAN